ncbi:hypothetical protein RUM44_001035 [Polyplax serrata]|uniref:Uncharacterized protein n=1 Tax=Polyplax serrata TaxID=468196 RepID=A0ABR1B9C3_POLSC
MAFIELHYGPYLESGIIKHRTNRLMNLVDYLQQKGHSVVLIPSIHFDTLEVVTALRVAFRCRITFLSQLNYNVFGKNHDPTFMKAIQAIDETLGRIGQVGPNIKVPGMYKGMFAISQDFGSGIIHNNSPELIAELMAEEDYDSESSNESERAIEKAHKRKKSIKFLNF